jgi:hypothetical protein
MELGEVDAIPFPVILLIPGAIALLAGLIGGGFKSQIG